MRVCLDLLLQMAGIDDCYTSARGSTGGGVAVINTSHLQQQIQTNSHEANAKQHLQPQQCVQ